MKRIADGLRRPHWYVPLLVASTAGEPAVLGPLASESAFYRDVAHALAARAMLRISTGDIKETEQDLLVVHRFAARITQEPTLTSLLLALYVDSIAVQGTIALAHSGQLTADQVRATARIHRAAP